MVIKSEARHWRLGHCQYIAFNVGLARHEVKAILMACELFVGILVPVINVMLSHSNEFSSNLLSLTLGAFDHTYSKDMKIIMKIFYNAWTEERINLIFLMHELKNQTRKLLVWTEI